VKGIRFHAGIQYDFCCDPPGVINIQALNTRGEFNFTKWIDPQVNGGAMNLMALMVHEARHANGFFHTCGTPVTKDNTLAQVGAWGVQYYLETYLSNNLTAPSFLSIPVPALANYYQQVEANDAKDLLK
jgi:hypothetical protein